MSVKPSVLLYAVNRSKPYIEISLRQMSRDLRVRPYRSICWSICGSACDSLTQKYTVNVYTVYILIHVRYTMNHLWQLSLENPFVFHFISFQSSKIKEFVLHEKSLRFSFLQQLISLQSSNKNRYHSQKNYSLSFKFVFQKFSSIKT